MSDDIENKIIEEQKKVEKGIPLKDSFPDIDHSSYDNLNESFERQDSHSGDEDSLGSGTPSITSNDDDI